MEDKNTEYKTRYSHKFTNIPNIICAFLNTDGGKIYVGYNDNGENIGVDEPDSVLRNINIDIQRYFPQWMSYIKSNVLTDGEKKCVVINVRKIEKEQYGYAYLNVNGQKVYYFRVGDRTIKTDEEHAPYWEVVGKYDLPIHDDYEPSDANKKEKFVQLKKQQEVAYKRIGLLPPGKNLYKYMDLESALLCLEKKVKGGKIEKSPNIRFVEPTSWDDQYEGRFYNACYKSKDGKDVDPKITPFLYACCFSSKRENEAAWVLYSHNRTGLASRCVEFTLNRMKLREELVKNQEKCSLYIGAVQYLNKEKIDIVHQQTIGKDGSLNVEYDKYFNPFTKECYLNLLLLKRSAFEHEKEVRIFIIPNDEMGNLKTRRNADGKFPQGVRPHSIYINIDWVEVIDEVRIDKNCTDYEFSLLQNSLNELVKARKKKDNLKKREYEELLSKFQLKKFDPYKDDSLEQGPLTIVTN